MANSHRDSTTTMEQVGSSIIFSISISILVSFKRKSAAAQN